MKKAKRRNNDNLTNKSQETVQNGSSNNSSDGTLNGNLTDAQVDG